MKKRIVSVLLIATMSVGLFSGCGKSGGNTEVKQNENSNKITLMTQDTTYGKAFDEYIHKAEEATGLEIETIACPTNTDDRQAKITTILSSGDDSIDVVTITVGCIILLPIVIFVLIFEKQIMEGVMAGGVKQ